MSIVKATVIAAGLALAGIVPASAGEGSPDIAIPFVSHNGSQTSYGAFAPRAGANVTVVPRRPLARAARGDAPRGVLSLTRRDGLMTGV